MTNNVLTRIPMAFLFVIYTPPFNCTTILKLYGLRASWNSFSGGPSPIYPNHLLTHKHMLQGSLLNAHTHTHTFP